MFRCQRRYQGRALVVLLVFVIYMTFHFSKENSSILPFVLTYGIKQTDVGALKFVPERKIKQEDVGAITFVPEGKTLNGYIIYDCSKRHPGLCGGWSDRLSGILDTFIMSIISGRHFKIHHDRPCSLDGYLEPNKLDWKYKNNQPDTQDFMSLIDYSSKSIWGPIKDSKHLENMFRTNVTFIRLNWDLTRIFRQRKGIAEQIPWIAKLHYADIYFHMFHHLFIPGESVLGAYSEIRKKIKNKQLACVHARNGDSSSNRRNFSAIWNFLDSLDRSQYDIFIASDSKIIREDAARALQGHNVITNPGTVGNIDQTNNNCDIFKTSMVDFYTLTQCDILVLTYSGYGMAAAYVRRTSDGLYCYAIANGVFPCSRYTLEDLYGGNFLAPNS